MLSSVKSFGYGSVPPSAPRPSCCSEPPESRLRRSRGPGPSLQSTRPAIVAVVGWTWILWFWLVWTLIGAVVGKSKGRQGQGALLGLLLEPIGVLIVALLDGTPEKRRADAQDLHAAIVGDFRPRVPGAYRAPSSLDRPAKSRLSNEPIRAEALGQAGGSTITASVKHLERRQVRDASDWILVDGPSPLIVLLDGRAVQIGPESWTPLPNDAHHGIDSDGRSH